MTTETIRPLPGQSLATEPTDWSGGRAIVRVACSHLPWHAGLTLEVRELQANGALAGEWRRVAHFQADEERSIAISPGQLRWQLSQPMGASQTPTFTVSVEPRERQPKAA